MTMTQESIQLINIDQELRRLWDEEQGKDKVRACLFTLIIYSQKSERDPFCQEMIRSVISKFPCRVILITSDEKTTSDSLSTRVTTETIKSGQLQVFCEIIHVQASGLNTLNRIPFIVLPHILPDLPVYLLWTQDPSAENAILPHFEPFARRIIFDSESTANLQKFSQSILGLMKRFQGEVGDLNWSALKGWKTLFRTFFETQELLEVLRQSTRIVISYNRKSTQFYRHTEIRAAYLQAWLAAQLGWNFQSIEKEERLFRLNYSQQSLQTEIILVEDEAQELSPGSITSVEIESLKNKAHIVFRRHPEVRQVFVQYSDQERCELPYALFLCGAHHGQEIVDEIFNDQTGTHYKNMLQVLAQIPWENK